MQGIEAIFTIVSALCIIGSFQDSRHAIELMVRFAEPCMLQCAFMPWRGNGHKIISKMAAANLGNIFSAL
jgi:hypothetical protein